MSVDTWNEKKGKDLGRFNFNSTKNFENVETGTNGMEVFQGFSEISENRTIHSINRDLRKYLEANQMKQKFLPINFRKFIYIIYLGRLSSLEIQTKIFRYKKSAGG